MSRELSFYAKLLQDFAIYIGFLIIFLLLLFKILIPQIESILTNRTLLNDSQGKLDNLETKVRILRGYNKEATREQLKKLNLALPLQKDIGLMLSSLDSVAARSKAQLGTFSIKVGSFATPSAVTRDGTLGVPSLEVKLNISGEPRKIAEFIKQTRAVVPIMQVSKVALAGLSSSVDLVYYYQPAIPINSVVDVPLPMISSSQEKILGDIETRVSALATGGVETEINSSSRTDPFN